MADLLNYLFSASAAWIWLLLLTAVASIIYFRHDSFALTDFTYRFPVVGKLARFSRDYSETKRGGWLNVESTLCHDYARHVTSLSKAEFQRNIDYLRKSYDHGRKPMPLKIVALLGVLVVLEAVGFAYLLGSWMAMESSENLRIYLAGAIVLVLALILIWVTHSAGHQLYRTRLLRGCFQQFQASMLEPPADPPAAAAARPRVFSSEIIALNQDQSTDDHLPPHVQCANRVITRPDDLGSYAWLWVAGLLVAFIAIISIVLRMETMHSVDLLASEFAGGSGAGGEGQAAAAAARETAALASFAMLSVIFVVTQLVGMGVGYWYGFAGKQSREAYRATAGCADFDTYFAPVRRRMSIADLRLTTLHRLMERRLPHEINWSRDFLEFIREERKRGATDLQDPTDLDAPSGPPAPPDPPNPGLGAGLVATALPEKRDDEERPAL
jgi:hypothetical protein